ncbi:MAG: SDR family NAD(P)-dependent oxidoreductase [Deltaproteobacteria bacterium]|jgi:NAD(P)-dependent dehydrogenase (short-subunit alcohol dehydrogenase family)|nr:SDR family NAD(P)-dependent oxidoreductase [Deltaproteobacteria bacterium]
MGRLADKVAIVTGAGRGIGRAYALAFAREGARVVVNDIGTSLQGRGTSEEPAAVVAREIEALGGKALASDADVADFEKVARTVAETLDAFGRIDVLVTNAGISRRMPITELTEEGWDTTIGAHLKGTYNFVHHVAPHMLSKGSGTILTVTSGAAWVPNPRSLAYSAAKGGIFSLTIGLAAELAGSGVTVNALSPGLTSTRLGNGALEEIRSSTTLSEQEIADLVGPIQPAEAMAPLAIFLASEAGRRITGRIFEVAGNSIHTIRPASRERSFVRDGGWSTDDLFDSFPRSLD